MISGARRAHYLSQALPIRLGGLAADLARVGSFAEIPAPAAVESLLDESRAFIEWVAPELPIDDAARLVDIQRGLTRWSRVWSAAQDDANQRAELAEQARGWSDEILALSGLLGTSDVLE